MISAIKAKEQADLATEFDAIIVDVFKCIDSASNNKKYDINLALESHSITCLDDIIINNKCIKDKLSYLNRPLLYVFENTISIPNLTSLRIIRLTNILQSKGFYCSTKLYEVNVAFQDSNEESRQYKERFNLLNVSWKDAK